MKAFMLSLVLLAVITAAAAVGLNMLPQSSREAYTEKGNVRL